jgi:hypothetical protein
MSGKMPNSSPGLAPAWLIGKRYEIADVDSRVLPRGDRLSRAINENGRISILPGSRGS